MKIDPVVLLAFLAVAFGLGMWARGFIDANYEQFAYYIRWAVYVVLGCGALMGGLALLQGWRP